MTLAILVAGLAIGTVIGAGVMSWIAIAREADQRSAHADEQNQQDQIADGPPRLDLAVTRTHLNGNARRPRGQSTRAE